MSKRKILALLLAVAMICSLCVSPALAAEDAGEPVVISDNAGPLFTDIEGHWSESAINRWASYGIIQGDGDGTVRPNRTLKRDELATILTRLLGLKETAPAGTFTDVPADAWYADAVLKCAAAGIMLGDGAGHANPESPIDRQQTIVMVARALGAKASNSKSLSYFKDGDAVADWAAPYLAALTDMGILNGLPDGDGFVVAPEDNINRAGLFALLDKAIGQYVTTPTTVIANDPNKFVVINTDAGEDVTVTGAAAGIVVGAGSTDDVILDNATVGTLKVDAPVNVIIKKGSAVTDLDANAAVKVENNGTVTNLNTNADDVTFDGNKPTAVNTAEDVEPAKDSKGVEVTPAAASTNNTSSSSRPSSTTRADIVAATIADHADADKAIAAEDLGKVTVTSSKVSGKTNEYNVTITGTNIMNHTNADGNPGHWVGFGMPAAPEGEEYTFKMDGTAKDKIKERTQETNGKTYHTAYFSAATEEEFNAAKVVMTVENSAGEVVMTYNVSFKVTFWSAKNVKVLATKADTAAAIEALEKDGTPWAHKFADGLGLTAAVKNTTVTLTGETTKASLQNTDTGADGGDGYLTYVLQVTDSVIAGMKVDNAPAALDELGMDGVTLVVNQKFYKGDAKEFISHDVTFELVDAANRVQDSITVTVDGTQVAIEGMKKVTFKAGDKVLKSVADATGESVTAPSIPEHTDKLYYTGAWLDEAGEVATAPFTVGTEDATYTAESAPITAQTFTFRPNGPENHGDPAAQNFAYATAYGKAGLKLANGVLTLDGAALVKYAANAANATELSHLMHANGKTIVCGVAYTVPAGATHVGCITNLTDPVDATIELVQDNDNGTIHGKQPISYIPVADVEGGVVTFKDDATMDADYYVWYKGEKVISVTKADLKRKTDVPTFTVTFADCDVAAQTVEYNKTATKPADPTKDLAIFEGWFVGDEEFDFTTPITANVTVTAKWTKIVELTVTAYDFSCPDGDAQYITFTLKNGNKPFYIAESTVEECWYRANRAADGEWTKDEGVELFVGDIDDASAFEGMDKEHQLGWTVSRRAEDTTAYWRFIGTDGTIYQATFQVSKKIANPTNATWGDTKVAEKDLNVLPVAVVTPPEETPEENPEETPVETDETEQTEQTTDTTTDET